MTTASCGAAKGTIDYMEVTQKKQHTREWPVILAIVLLVAAFLFGAGMLFYHYTSDMLYEESVTQLEELSAQLFEKLDVQIELQWDYLDKLEEVFGASADMSVDDAAATLQHYEEHLSPAGKRIYLRLLDSDGYYYTHDGRNGLWTGFDSISEKDRQSFLLSNWGNEESYMAFTQRVSKSISVGGREITHLVLLRTMDDMQPFFHSTAFGNRNMVYIVDAAGLVLFEDGTLDGVDFAGRNIFHSLNGSEFPHIAGVDALHDAGAKGDTVCTDVTIGGQRFYIVYDTLPEYDWGMLMLVSDDDVATSTAEMISSMLQVFVFVLFLLLLLVLTAFVFIARVHRDRKVLEANERNERMLMAANLDLQKSQKETAEALTIAQAATKAKSQFLSNMSHDIRTPMNAIVGIATLMEHDVEDADKQRYYIKKIQNSSSHMLGLINDILDMSKIESGEVHLNVEHVRLAEQVGQIESIIRSQSNERRQTFTVIVHEIAHEYLIGDAIRLRQVYLNLLSNAVKYTPEGGDIRMELRELPCDEPGHATILTSVIDNGYGMTQEFLKHIFEPFSRAENSVTNKVQGTGLGMSITKSIVDLMGGTITVESEVDRGSRFDVTVTFPIDDEKQHEDPVRSVLLVTDDDVLIKNIRAALSEEPVTLRVAASPAEAVSMLQAEPAGAVMLSGYLSDSHLGETVAMLRGAARDAVLVLCCDYAQRDLVRDVLLKSGVDGLVARPFFYENLIRAVEGAQKSASPTEAESRSPLAGMRFLCAEDNELNAEILEALLTLNSATCKICKNGAEIVEEFKSVRPGDYDAILMDVQMPVMNGMDATRAIRRSENKLGATMPIIAMTANAFSTDIEDCLAAGMDAHLAKPLDISALERTLHDVLSSSVAGGGTPVRNRQT